MSSPILPTSDLQGSSTDMPSSDSGAAGVAVYASELEETALALVASRGGPPPEVVDQIAAASRVEAELRESGQHLRFFAAGGGERTEIEIHDRDGNALRTLSITEVIELAAGKPLG
jgi:hypothetical protein